MDNNSEEPRTLGGIYLPKGSEIADKMATQEIKPVDSSDGLRTPGGIYLPKDSKIAQEMTAPENNEWVSTGSSQGENVDITKYKESLLPPLETVAKNAEETGKNTESLIMVEEIEKPTPININVDDTIPKPEDKGPILPIQQKPVVDNTPYDLESGSGYDPAPKKPFDLEFGSDEEKPFDLEFGDDSLPDKPLDQEGKQEIIPPSEPEVKIIDTPEITNVTPIAPKGPEEIKETKNTPKITVDTIERLSKNEQLPKEDKEVIDAVKILINNNPEFKASFDKILAEQKGEPKKEEVKENTYTDKDGKLVNIPLPIQEEMDLIFNKDSNVINPEIAASYGFMENNLYNERLSAKIAELKSKGWSDKEIDSYMKIAKYEIKESVQQYVKGTVTRDIRLKVIDRILKDPVKYKDFIDPTTGKVIDSIASENIIGEILGQKIYPQWELGEKNSKPEIIEPDPSKERNWKRAALIAGVVAGGATGILGGVPAAGIGALACIGAGVINKGVDFIGGRRINKLTEQLKTTTDPESRAKIEKRIKNWEKARKGTEYVKSFLTGAKLGLLGSSIFSGVFMGGHGLVWNTPEIPTAIPTTTSGSPEASGSLGNNPTVETPPVDQGVPLTDGGVPTTELPTEAYDLFANGRLNLPGSAMDGWKLADIPKGWENVQLENIPDNMFANSASKFFHIFIRDAGAAGYTNSQISEAVSKMGPQVAHQIFREGAYSGQSILQSMIEGGWLPTK